MKARLFPWLTLLLFLAAPRLWAYSYGPACQWIRLHGHIEWESGFVPKQPVLLTVTYQTDGQKFPAVLLSSYPLTGREFFFVMSTFKENIGRAVFLPVHFPFDESVHFQYYATAANGLHRSEFLQAEYKPQYPHRGQEHLCKTDLDLGGVKLKRKKL